MFSSTDPTISKCGSNLINGGHTILRGVCPINYENFSIYVAIQNHFKYLLRLYPLEKEHKIAKTNLGLSHMPCFDVTRFQVPSANEASCIACIAVMEIHPLLSLHGFHMVVNVSQQCRKCRRGRI